MKKSVAILLTVIGGLPAVFGISVLNLFMFFSLFPFGVLAAIALTAGAAFGNDRLRVLFAKKYGISAPKFLLCACAKRAWHNFYRLGTFACGFGCRYIYRSALLIKKTER